ncbi:MAG: branched-chain amino acid transporter AzlD [Lachnospiraceae bacterium]|nr:branched-chain amino acid transporter AzlD [Lachnospiraceae bacterium]
MEECMSYFILMVVVASVCTILLRAFPFLLFGGKREIPDIIHYLGRVLPPAIMVILVIYCMKGISFLTSPYGLPELLSVVIVVLLHVWKRNILLSVGIGTALYMFLIQVVF